jgi:5-methylcytosine-specific restriction endonuclease McrA
MNFSKISNQELQFRLEKLIRIERKTTHLMLWHINEIESRKLFAELGFSSMFEYLTKHFGFGESSAYRRIQSARLLKQIPHLAEKLEEGSLNLTQLTKVQTCLKKEHQKVDIQMAEQILEKLENKSSFETEKILAQELNLPMQTIETLTPQKDHSVCLKIYLTEEQMAELQLSKDLLSHALPNATWAEVIFHLAQKHNQKILGKTKKAQNPRDQNQDLQKETENIQAKNNPVKPGKLTRHFFSKQARKFIGITVKRKLLQKANYRCEYEDITSGRRCECRYQLQTDHRIPLARGGTNEIENLRILCRTHNLSEARRWGLI